jgi:hypothetical protein
MDNYIFTNVYFIYDSSSLILFSGLFANQNFRHCFWAYSNDSSGRNLENFAVYVYSLL